MTPLKQQISVSTEKKVSGDITAIDISMICYCHLFPLKMVSVDIFCFSGVILSH